MNHRHIEILSINYLRGPNMWTYRPVLEALVDIGDLEDCPSNLIPGFTDRLLAWLPSLVEHRCSVGERGGFVQRLREGTWPAHILEHVTLELQNLAGMPGGFGKAREAGPRGFYKVVVRAWHATVTQAALYHARDLLMAAIDDEPFDVAATLDELREMNDTLCLGPSTACIVDAADDRNIPYIRLSEGNLVQLGYGCRQRRIWTAETDSTSAIAETVSRDKDLTKTLLEACGVPIPHGRLVDSPADAWAAAQDIGLPVVVKPSDANHGRGVCIDLSAQEEIETAYHTAIREGSSVIVEQFIPGNEHRLLVVGNRVVAAAKGETAEIVGDGRHTVSELIEQQLNSDPRRGYTEECPLNPVRLDTSAMLELQRQGYDGRSIPPAGRQVLVQRNGNVAFDVTADMHPSVAHAAALAARVVGLDIAGIDMVMEDIALPLDAQRGAIVEVNAGPGLLMHLKPASGESRPVGKAIVDHLFAPDESGRIPVIGIAASQADGWVARLIAQGLRLAGQHVGLACRHGLFLGARQVESGDQANGRAANRLLLNRAVEAAVIENPLRVILSEGLAYDRCQIGIVTGIDAEDLPDDTYIQSTEMLFKVMRTQIDVVLPTGTGILNVDDPLVAGMAELCDGDLIVYSQHPRNPLLKRHLAQGDRVVVVELEFDGWRICLQGPETKTELRVAGDLQQSIVYLPCLLPAIAALWALHLPMAAMQQALDTFDLQATS
ncbi:MAG: cyanophycin synthetase [Burkholderiaceae bacterium]|jgi:cyanophycin synthetase